MSFRRIGEIMPQTLEGMGLLQRVRLMRVRSAWSAATGRVAPELASGYRAMDLQHGVLTVHGLDQRRNDLLQRCATKLVQALNAELGETLVERVVMVT
jgi:predicted nucleic acid-binding Zn ribbon protein